ncbi:hypothetical protein CFC21_001933 [Triticum aestivum]|uniref:BZIP domain-containing protein n=1 Tax=Triticum aestivum TaxID=4565 RepID=A0A3B5XZ64_WHEAT|nr:bZIP transcription factor 29-like [Triticum aestivum]KAF6983835.1 hypothetical protein CFC21_001933 [Triticum aestivum]
MGTTNELMHRHVQAAAVPPLPASFAATSARGMGSQPGQGGRQRAGLPPTPPSGAGSHSLHVADACMPMQDDSAPRKAHRRSCSDVPFGYFPPPSPKTESGWGLPCAGGGGGGGGGDELFNAFMSMEGMDGLNSSDGDSRGSSMPPANGADSSENESEDYSGVESQVFLWGEAGRKRNAAGEPAAAATRHARSLSMDSLMGKLSFSANGGEPSKFSLEFGSGEFTPAEMKRIMADEKLAEMALADPKRVKRVLANRQSAARSKERRMRYIAELEHKVQILQTEATTLSAQLTHLQRDSSGLATHNNELKFRLQAMEQQAQLRDALNEALTGEVQRLKQSATSERGGDAGSSSNLAQQMQLRCQNQMLEMHKQQQQQIPFYQLEQPEQNGESN